MMPESFNVLTIDGGGIRGIFPAKFLANLEDQLCRANNPKTRIYEHFNLISGTSTGGIIAIALALGIPAQEIFDLYLKKAGEIFGKKRWWFQRWTLLSKFKRDPLERNIRAAFRRHFGEKDPRLGDCKVPVCVPIFDLLQGKPSMLKSNYHPLFIRDYHIPAYQAALATSAAPTFFDPFSDNYQKIDSNSIESFSNKVDGGVFANNPTLLALIEAQKAFNKELKDIRILSIGTGYRKYSDGEDRKHWGPLYWFNLRRRRIIELFMQAQSQNTDNLMSLLKNGIDKSESDNFGYMRIDTAFDSEFDMGLDETNPKKLEKLAEKAQAEFQNNGNKVIEIFCNK